jgi:hypothetical protein
MRLMCLKPDPMFSSVKTQRANGVAELLLLQWPLCRRQFKIDHLCQLNFDQGSKAGCLAPGCG